MSLQDVLRSSCPACGAALTLHERHSGGFCQDWRCRWQRTKLQRESEFEQEMQRQRDAAAMLGNSPEASTAPLVFVRRDPPGLEAVSPAQREDLRAHLMTLLPKVEALALAVNAGEMEAEDAVPVSGKDRLAGEVDALLAQVCASCTGHCCRHGFGRQAFLDAETLFRAWLSSPELSHEELALSYLEAIPDWHHVESCAFHGEHGCALPRHRRANVCNEFECSGLEMTRELAEQQGVRRVYVVRHDGLEQGHGAFVPPLPAPGNGGQ